MIQKNNTVRLFLAVDNRDRTLYWTSSLGIVQRMALQGGALTDVISSGKYSGTIYMIKPN